MTSCAYIYIYDVLRIPVSFNQFYWANLFPEPILIFMITCCLWPCNLWYTIPNSDDTLVTRKVCCFAKLPGQTTCTAQPLKFSVRNNHNWPEILPRVWNRQCTLLVSKSGGGLNYLCTCLLSCTIDAVHNIDMPIPVNLLLRHGETKFTIAVHLSLSRLERKPSMFRHTQFLCLHWRCF